MIPHALAQAITALPSISGAPAPTSPASLVAYLFIAGLSLGGIAALTAFVIGALRYFFAAGNASATADAKDRMLHALGGTLILVVSVVFLANINPSLLKLKNPTLPTLQLPTQRAAGACTVTAAQWAGGLIAGSEVGLVATMRDCASGTEVLFTIKRGSTVLTTLTAPVRGSSAGTFWTVPAGSTEGLRFEASVGGFTAFSSTGGGGGGESPVAGTCTNPTQGSIAPSSCTAPCASKVTEAVYGVGNGCTDIIKRAASEFSVPASLIVAVMQHECSSGEPTCQYSKNFDGSVDCGLLQVNSAIVSNVGCWKNLGQTESNSLRACEILKANPGLAVRVGACRLAQVRRSAESAKSAHGYAASIVSLTAAGYASGEAANDPSCNCRPSGGDVPRGCSSTSHICQNCGTVIPRWMCAHDYATAQPSNCASAIPLNTCFLNDQNPCRTYKTAKEFAATMENYAAHFGGCVEWR